MLVSDLDGTLLFKDRPIHRQEIEAFDRLEQEGTLRVIATGRAWGSVKKILSPDFPVDYVIFSSGAGVVEWKTQKLLVSHNLTPDEVSQACETFYDYDLDFMLHDPLPRARPFLYSRGQGANPDFDARLESLAPHGTPFTWELRHRPASQLIAIVPSRDLVFPFEELKKELQGMAVLRSTSPLDNRSLWIEVCSAHATKSNGAKWVADRYGIHRAEILAVGNDFNDWDLLNWAGSAYVMDNAPVALREEFESVSSLHGVGVSQAIGHWLDR
jgi:Cof subfamily protein (haloacid dehalogenase superfamily)